MRKETLKESFKTALPIMAGYVVLGIPCGILCATAGMDVWMVALMCALFYSGAGQYMIPNMYLAGNPLTAIIASVSLVNTRQMLYGASLSQFCGTCRKRLAFLFGATVTDESFGVNLARFINGEWPVGSALAVNLFSQGAWLLSNVAGAVVGSAVSLPTALASFAMTALFICLLCMQKVTRANAVAAVSAMVGVVALVGSAVSLPTALASFAMTALFICLLCMQKVTRANAVAAVSAMVGVVACKLVGLSGPAILIGALIGVGAALAFSLKAGEKEDSDIRMGA